MYSYYVGVDLGQSGDFTAITILEQPLWVSSDLYESHTANNWQPDTWVSPEAITPHQTRLALHDDSPLPHKPDLHVRWLERVPLGTKYTEIVKHVAGIVQRRAFTERGIVLLVDKTGVGQGVVEMFHEAELRPTAITITGGDSVNRDRGGYRVPKRDLVSSAQAALQTRRLVIPDRLPDAEALKHELQSFRIKINLRTAHDSYEAWRESDHDDLLLSLAMAAWFRDYYCKNLDAARLNAPREATEQQRPQTRVERALGIRR